SSARRRTATSARSRRRCRWPRCSATPPRSARPPRASRSSPLSSRGTCSSRRTSRKSSSRRRTRSRRPPQARSRQDDTAMYHKEVNQLSPIRILEASIHAVLRKEHLGLVMARVCVGKTACLVQIALDDLLRERPVLHVSLDQTMDHVLSWYDALFDDLAMTTDMEDAELARQMVQRHRMIASFTDHDLWPDRLEKTVEMFSRHLQFRPAAILVDGYPWTAHSTTENAAMIGAFKAYAKMLEAELSMSAQTHRSATG